MRRRPVRPFLALPCRKWAQEVARSASEVRGEWARPSQRRNHDAYLAARHRRPGWSLCREHLARRGPGGWPDDLAARSPGARRAAARPAAAGDADAGNAAGPDAGTIVRVAAAAHLGAHTGAVRPFGQEC